MARAALPGNGVVNVRRGILVALRYPHRLPYILPASYMRPPTAPTSPEPGATPTGCPPPVPCVASAARLASRLARLYAAPGVDLGGNGAVALPGGRGRARSLALFLAWEFSRAVEITGEDGAGGHYGFTKLPNFLRLIPASYPTHRYRSLATARYYHVSFIIPARITAAYYLHRQFVYLIHIWRNRQ